jgi:hypothetical protein
VFRPTSIEGRSILGTGRDEGAPAASVRLVPPDLAPADAVQMEPAWVVGGRGPERGIDALHSVRLDSRSGKAGPRRAAAISLWRLRHIIG